MRYVLMAIPTELVSRVADLLAGFEVEASRGPAAARSTDQSDGLLNGWTGGLIERAYRDSADPMREVLRFLADRPGEEITSEDIAAHIHAEHGWNTVAGMLGAFGRRSANRYKRTLPMWHVRYTDDGRALLTMPAAVAETIKSVAGE